MTGYGVVEPLEALTRPLRPGKDGEYADTTSARDESPRPGPPSPRSTPSPTAAHRPVGLDPRRCCLLLALMLRPVLRGAATDRAR